ncbi:MAG: metallophosphoesterase [Chloroflexota bacterium]|jgi:uncharacterized protein
MPSPFDTLPADDVLTKSFFHKVLVFFNHPAGWPDWMVTGLTLVLAGISGLWWWFFYRDPGIAIGVAAVQALFFLTDRLILRQLPVRNISFGPWKGQILALMVPRLGATLILGIGGLWLDQPVAVWLMLAVQAVGTIALIRGTLIEPRHLTFTNLATTTDRMAMNLDPIRILHITDLHIERLSLREHRLMELVLESKPDLIIITGDYVNLSFNQDPITYEQVRAFLSGLSAPYGVFAVLGSPPVDLHDSIPDLFQDLPVSLLRNEIVEVDLAAGRCLTLVGMDCHHDIERDATTFERLISTITDANPILLLYHSPELMPQAVSHGIDLYACGHTHGGQVRLPLIGPIVTSSRLGRRYVMGHYHEGRTHLYVSRGIGFEGLGAPRVRLLCPPEVTLITMRPEPTSKAG